MIPKETQKYLGVPKALGLAMILQALFYKGITPAENLSSGFTSYLHFAYGVSFWGYIITGILLIMAIRPAFMLAAIVIAMTLFGGAFSFSAQTEFSYFRIISEIIANIGLIFMLFFARYHLDKAMIQAEVLAEKYKNLLEEESDENSEDIDDE